MVGVSHVSDVKKPDISVVQNLVVWLVEEVLKVTCWFDQVTEPKHGWEIVLSSFEVGTTKLNGAIACLSLGLCD